MTGRPSKGFLNLQRVVVAEPQTGEAIQVLGLELYDDGLAVRWGSLPSGTGAMRETVQDAGLSPIQLQHWTLGALPSVLPSPFPETIDEAGPNPLGIMNIGDDLQTSYERAGLSGETLRGLAYFTPAIPDEVTWLEVFVKYGIVRFEL